MSDMRSMFVGRESCCAGAGVSISLCSPGLYLSVGGFVGFFPLNCSFMFALWRDVSCSP